MLRLGIFKSTSKLIKLITYFILSGAIFNLGSLTSHKCTQNTRLTEIARDEEGTKIFTHADNSVNLTVKQAVWGAAVDTARENRAPWSGGRRYNVSFYPIHRTQNTMDTGTREMRNILTNNVHKDESKSKIGEYGVQGQTVNKARQQSIIGGIKRSFDGNLHNRLFAGEHKRNKQEHKEQNDEVNSTFVKEMISTLPKTRHLSPWGRLTLPCKDKVFNGTSTTSVIITFHENEKISRILHTVHSILQRTPQRLLREVILIDDYSKKGMIFTSAFGISEDCSHLGEDCPSSSKLSEAYILLDSRDRHVSDDLKEILHIYVKSVFGPKVSLHTNWLEKGLIGARLAGTRLAKGDVIVCMDSHMEVQENWLEPLLREIQVNPKTLAASYLDWMEYDPYTVRWTYKHGASTWKTYFDWTFTFGFQDIPLSDKNTRDPTEPITSPVTIGTIFAIDKKFFRQIGEFDDQMIGWGGENLDLPLRVWMFGGRVVNVPCSHVAHIEEPGQRNYRLSWEDSIVRNYRRVADVWLENHRFHVYHYRPRIKTANPGDLTARLQLRQNRTFNFTWFLKNVFPELGVPGQDVFAFGMLMNRGSKFCLSASPPNSPTISDCVGRRPEKTEFSWSLSGELRFPLHAFSAVHGYSESALRTDEWISYFNTSILSKWIHWKDGPLMEWTSRRCLSAGRGTYRLLLSTCNFTSPHQQWRFSSYTSDYDALSSTPPERKLILSSPTTVFEPFVAPYLKTLRDISRFMKQGEWKRLYKMTFQPSGT